MNTETAEKKMFLSVDLEMLRDRTRAFGPGRNIKVKYSFFLVFLGFLTLIIPPSFLREKGRTRPHNLVKIYHKTGEFVKVLFRLHGYPQECVLDHNDAFTRFPSYPIR